MSFAAQCILFSETAWSCIPVHFVLSPLSSCLLFSYLPLPFCLLVERKSTDQHLQLGLGVDHFHSSNGILGVARWTSCFRNARWVLVPLHCVWHVILNPSLGLVSLSFSLCSPGLRLTSCLVLHLALMVKFKTVIFIVSFVYFAI
jgi:hypothetical protein